MVESSYLVALFGGALIGLAASLLLLLNGRIAGISGIVGSLIGSGGGHAWRIAFVGGLVLAGVGAALLAPAHLPRAEGSVLPMAAAGLLVGFGARLGNGCTSGHGICGISRFSVRSLAATATFMATAAAVVFVIRHVIGGGA